MPRDFSKYHTSGNSWKFSRLEFNVLIYKMSENFEFEDFDIVESLLACPEDIKTFILDEIKSVVKANTD